VFKAKANSVEVWRDTWQVQERVEFVALRMPLRLDRCLLLGTEERNGQCRSGHQENRRKHAKDARNEFERSKWSIGLSQQAEEGKERCCFFFFEYLHDVSAVK
jgi:hypothetical protein